MFGLKFDIPETPIVQVHTTNNRGFTPEEIAERCADKLISISDTADPALKAQAHAYRRQMIAVLVFYLKEAVRSDRTTVYNAVKDAGHPELADALRRL